MFVYLLGNLCATFLVDLFRWNSVDKAEKGILTIGTARRFRTKRQLWTYSGLGIEMHSSDDHHVVKGLVFMIVLWIVRRGPSTSCHQIARALSSVSPLVLLLPR